VSTPERFSLKILYSPQASQAERLGPVRCCLPLHIPLKSCPFPFPVDVLRREI
jgi:hypothetical protein